MNRSSGRAPTKATHSQNAHTTKFEFLGMNEKGPPPNETERLRPIKGMEMTDYEAGYRARVAGEMVKEVNNHFAGKPLAKSDDWFTGYQDATDDMSWTLQGSEQMQFGLSCPA